MKLNYKKLVIPVLFLVLFALYLLIIVFVRYQDMWDHACFARDMLTGKRPTSGNFIFYWLVNIFSFFSTEKIPSKISLCFLLACASTYRFYLCEERIKEVVYSKNKIENQYWLAVFFAISLLFVFVIPIPSYFINHNFLIGNFSPNVWHNSTLIFLFPFALLLFEQSYRQLVSFDIKRNILITCLIFLNVFIKPSYFFVFICIYPLMLLVKYRFTKTFYRGIIPVVIGLLFLLFEFWTIYLTKNPLISEKSSVIFQPFYSSPLFTNLWSIPFSLLFSLLFPILYVVFNVEKLKNSTLFWYVFLSFLMSVIIYLFVGESGPRATHGNFWWQIIICSWICFFVSLLSLLKDFEVYGKNYKNKLLMLVYCSHVFVGLFYFGRLFVVNYL
jgi:hypothetical protein